MAYVDDLINLYLTPTIKYFQELAVYNELAQVTTSGMNVFDLAFQNLRTDLPYQVKKNNVLLSTTGDYNMDFVNGQIILTSAVVAGDEVRADYRFQYFPTVDLENWIELAVQELNGIKPISAYDIDSAPKEWGPAFVLRTYMRCLDRILLEINTWKARLIWPDPAGFSAYLQTMRTSAKTEFDNYAKHLKRRAMIAPVGVSSGKYYTQNLIDGVNWRNYTILGATN